MSLLPFIAVPVNEPTETQKQEILANPDIVNVLRLLVDSRLGMTNCEVSKGVGISAQDASTALGLLRSHGFVQCVPRGSCVHANITTVAGRDLLPPVENTSAPLPNDWLERAKAVKEGLLPKPLLN